MTNNIRRINKDYDIFGSVFDDLFKGIKSVDWNNLPKAGDANHPRINISTLSNVENGTQYTMEFALAGYKREEINAYVEDVPANGSIFKVLTVSVEPSNDDTMEYITKEISKRKASRKVILGSNDKIVDAQYEDGILTFVVFREDNKTDKRHAIEIK